MRILVTTITLCLFLLISYGCCEQQSRNESAAMFRYRTQGMLYEQDNEFYVEFQTSDINGLGLEEGISRRDPSGILKIEDTYYVWYTRAEGSQAVGQDNANRRVV